MAGIEGLSPAAGPVATRPPEDEIEDDEDEDVSYSKRKICSSWQICQSAAHRLSSHIYTTVDVLCGKIGLLAKIAS